ncbi:Ig-like domain-containing protein [Microbacterium esteraromaticum]|uniref:Ig-like domain-containing protein n=1 Tax=Microbacterium esteraromaticum TaxID=57043 RepID=UPI0028F6C667|nr:Ig-like domain-containing protein [Microbacterium esteraromaticum]
MIQSFRVRDGRRRPDARASSPVPRSRRRVALVAAAAIALSGIGLGTASPAHAAPLPQQVFDFTSPSGTDWVVPAGITEVVVGLRGGRGGFTERANGGSGADFGVTIPVKTGDRLTVFAGQPARGKGDERIGGAGFVSGGDGGKGSLLGASAGGGGGASAVKLNGELIAVAGGGGGGGGYTGKPMVSLSLWDLAAVIAAAGGYQGESSGSVNFGHVRGGEGGHNAGSSYDGKTITMFPATAGAGKHPGGIGQNAKNDPSFSRYKKPGANGGSASTSTSGGGGGGGGGGWPASGTGGGGGRTFLGYTAGSGGGAGLSWVTDAVPGVRIDRDARRPEDRHDYFGPLAETGTVRIMIPMRSTTTVSAPAQAMTGEQIRVRVRTADTRTPNTPLDGWVDLYQGSTRVAYGTTDGDRTFTVPGLGVGTHEFRAEFQPRADQRDFRERSTYSSGTATVTVAEPSLQQPGPGEVASRTALTVLTTPATFGDTLMLGASVTLDGPVNLSGQPVSFEVDGTVVASSPLIYSGAGRFSTLIPFSMVPTAGEHEVVARFPGVADADPATPDALPSVSDPMTFSVAQAPTTTRIMTAPATVRAFTPVDVEATVTSATRGLSGSAVLLADGSPLMYAPLMPGGTVLFDDVMLPTGAERLTVSYLGDPGGNFTMSTSAEHPVSITPVETAIALALSSSGIRADESVTLTATVTPAQPGVTTDPRGAVEFLLDGDVVRTVPAGMDGDPESDDGEARFEVEADTLPIGTHSVTARFVPAPGFGASTSDAAELEVRGIATVLTPRTSTIAGTPANPAFVELRATVSGDETRRAVAGDAVDGHVEARLGADPLGDPLVLVDGAGTLAFPGLPVGAHEVTLRFVPDSAAMLESSTTVTVTVTEDVAPGGDDDETAPGGGDEQPVPGGDGEASPGVDGALPSTGGDSTGMLLLALSLIVGAGVMFVVARLRRSKA